jgi:triacylglycerol lipase
MAGDTRRDLGSPTLAIPRARVLREYWSTRDSSGWPAPPAGDGRPAMLIPGFLAGDPSLSRMARWLRSGGYETTRSGVTWNVACMEPTLSSVEQRLESAVARAGRRALLVGQSRGGVIGRALAVRRPDLVETLVTLGSPVRDQLAVHPHQWLPIGVVGALGTLGVPGLFSLKCFRGECCARAQAEVTMPLPGGVEYLAVYSRDDEVVKWEACLDPAAKQLEVSCSHVGMGMDAAVWRCVTRELRLLDPA